MCLIELTICFRTVCRYPTLNRLYLSFTKQDSHCGGSSAAFIKNLRILGGSRVGQQKPICQRGFAISCMQKLSLHGALNPCIYKIDLQHRYYHYCLAPLVGIGFLLSHILYSNHWFEHSAILSSASRLISNVAVW